MKALSIRQPWAWLVANGHKPVENRTRHTKHRGPFLIHASATCTAADYAAALLFIQGFRPELLHEIPKRDDLQRGGIVGIGDLVDSVEEHRSPWFTGGAANGGGTGYLIAHARPLPFMMCAGALGFFNVPGEWS